MHAHSVRQFKLSSPGDRGISCDANGAFIDDVALLKRVVANGKEKWAPHDGNDISADLSERYGLADCWARVVFEDQTNPAICGVVSDSVSKSRDITTFNIAMVLS